MSTGTPSPADPLGYDMSYAGGDLDPLGNAATGLELVEEAILDRLQCGRLCMIDAPDDEVEYGEDVRLWVAEAVTPSSVAAKGPRLSIVLQRDERIARADVKVSVASGQTFADGSDVDIIVEITAALTTGAVLERIVGVSQITVEFLAQGT